MSLDDNNIDRQLTGINGSISRLIGDLEYGY